jgi:predicted TIM-barrel fold metal-dependent hydrolase
MLLDLPVVDAHLHWWDRTANPYPWLAPGSPRPALGDHRALMRDRRAADWLEEIGVLLPVVAGVHVEAGCADPLAEARWVAEEAARAGLPVVHVARVDLTRADARERIAELAALDHVRGLRMRLNADPRIAGRAGIADEPAFREGFAELARHGLLFELSIFPPQAAEGVRLARDFPGVPIVLNHLGWPRIEEGLDDRAGWRAAMAALAACPGLTVKLSMLFPIDRAWRAEVIRPFVLETLELFGPERVMWGSNWPIETVMGAARDQLLALVGILGGLDRGALEAIFRTTAARVYRLPGA